MRTLFIIVLFLSLFSGCTTNTEVDLIVHNAKVYTVDSTFTKVEAFAIKNGIFIDIGKSKDILKKYKAKEVIDAEGKAVYPGFYDAHTHFFTYSHLLEQVDLGGITSEDEIIKKLSQYKSTLASDKWIVGGGWDQNLWKNKTLPTKDSLDKYFPNTPVFLYRIDYHAALANSAALKIANIDTVFDVEGGIIMKDSLGKPSGLLVDNAMNLVSKYLPNNTRKTPLAMLKRAQDSLLAVGLTSIVEAGIVDEQIETLKSYYKSDSLKIRNYAMILAEPHNISKYINDNYYESDKLTIKGVKLMIDGALGSRGALLKAPYSDDSTRSGLLLHAIDEFDESLRELANSPFQVSIHAIGDSANKIILDLYGKHIADKKDRRWRIEHAQIVSAEDMQKFRQYNVFPSIQPTHATSDMNWLYSRIGQERAKGAYAYKDLLKQYGKVAIGTDFPIEHINPLYSFHAAVARQDKNNLPAAGFQMENALTREEALRGMTIWAAYSCFQEKKRGSIEKGKDADFVILEEDIMTAELSKLRQIKTLRTVIAGETVYKR